MEFTGLTSASHMLLPEAGYGSEEGYVGSEISGAVSGFTTPGASRLQASQLTQRSTTMQRLHRDATSSSMIAYLIPRLHLHFYLSTPLPDIVIVCSLLHDFHVLMDPSASVLNTSLNLNWWITYLDFHCQGLPRGVLKPVRTPVATLGSLGVCIYVLASRHWLISCSPIHMT